MLYAHYSEAPWDADRWPNLSASELSCYSSRYAHGKVVQTPCQFCGGAYFHDERHLDQLQAARHIVGAPFWFNSGHRCGSRNALVGGAPRGMHRLRTASDISLHNHADRKAVYQALRKAGFETFGFYITMIHVDMRAGRKARHWFSGERAKALWI